MARFAASSQKGPLTGFFLARFVENEVVRLKNLGMDFPRIAEQVTLIGRGRTKSITELPRIYAFHSTIEFPPKAAIRPIARPCDASLRSRSRSTGRWTLHVARK